MAAQNQDFTTYAGDAVQPVFTVYSDSANTVPVDISGALEITWACQTNPQTAPAISKKKSTGGISFLTDGRDGKFFVNILESDTTPLSGYYFYTATLTDFEGNITTVSTGQVRVGVQPVSTYSGNPGASANDYVRSLIGDTDMDAPSLTDNEITNLLANNPGPLFAAAAACRMLGMRFAGKANRKVGDLSISYGDIVKNYLAMADEFDAKAKISGNQPYAGGISKADIETNNQNSDRVRGPFSTDQFDNPLADNSPGPSSNWPFP